MYGTVRNAAAQPAAQPFLLPGATNDSQGLHSMPMAAHFAAEDGQLEERLIGKDDDKGATSRSAMTTIRDRLPDFLLPWAIFTLVLATLSLMEDGVLGYTSAVLTLLLACAFLYLSQGRSWRLLAFICFAAIILAVCLAMYSQANYLEEYYVIKQSRWYGNVRAEENPAAKKDASVITFSEDAFVDVSRSVGFQSGDMYCAAPVVNSEDQTSVGYWAIGMNCCQVRGRFNCGDIWTSSKSSVVLPDLGGYSSYSRQNMFMTAVRAAASTYQLSLSSSPTVMFWTEDVDGFMFDIWMGAFYLVLTVILVFLVIAICFGTVCPVLGDAGIIHDLHLRGDVPHEDKIKRMRFGPDWWCFGRQPEPDRSLDFQLRIQRAYLCGEVIHDYIFYVCNAHIFIGVFGCHPSHPFSRLKRFVIALCVGLLVVFPMATISAMTGANANIWLRILFVAFLVVVTRNLIKNTLRRAAAEVDELDYVAAEQVRDAQSRAHKQEVAALITLFFFTAIAVGVCLYLLMASGAPVFKKLYISIDAIVFVIVLELAVDLFYPSLEKAAFGKVWAIGFFGKWLLEQRQAAPDADSVEATAQAGNYIIPPAAAQAGYYTFPPTATQKESGNPPPAEARTVHSPVSLNRAL